MVFLGVLDTNAFIVGENLDYDVHLQGLFPTASILNHSCSANTSFFPSDNYVFACRAVQNIEKGEELTTNYLHFQYHYFGSTYRQHQLEKVWHFKCDCLRCKNRTDFGLFTDGLLCNNCLNGIIIPLKIKEGYNWVCCDCSQLKSSEVTRTILDKWWNIIEQTSRYDIALLNQLLLEAEKVFYKNHYCILEIKRRIIENIGETNGNTYEHLAEVWLDKKVIFCQDHLKIQEQLAPGLSKYRAYISFHIAEPLYWLTNKRYAAKQCSEKELHDTMEQIAEHLLVVIQIWGPYRLGSGERLKAENARNLLEMVNDMYLHHKYEQI